MIQLAETDEQIDGCFDVMSSLRPHLRRDGFPALIRAMAAEGYRLAYLTDAGEVVAVAGYRVSTNLHLGRHLYVDDLVTSAEVRSRGHGEAMLRWLESQARAAGCRYLDLSSGTQRSGAHRFYFRHGFSIGSYHFTRLLQPQPPAG